MYSAVIERLLARQGPQAKNIALRGEGLGGARSVTTALNAGG